MYITYIDILVYIKYDTYIYIVLYIVTYNTINEHNIFNECP